MPRCRLRFALVPFLLLAAVAPARAQLAWSVFDETTVAAAPSTGDKVVVTVAPGQRATLVASNLVPIDLTAPAAANVPVSVTFTASGGLASLAAGTRAIGFGLFNRAATAGFTDDGGYFVWVNGRSTGSLLEMRRRNGTGASPSLLNPTGASFANLGTGSAVQTAGALADGVPYTLTLRLVRSAGGIALGTGTGTDAAGAWLRGDGLSQTAYTNPDPAPAATVFDQIAFMFLNTGATPVTLTLENVAGVSPQTPPTISVAPQPLILNLQQAGTLSVTAAGAAPLAYQWSKDGVPIAGATGAALALTGAATDPGSYSVTVSNPFGSTTSPGAAVTISSTPVPATIQTQPVSVAVNAGQGATLAVQAFGSAPLTYEWQRNGTPIAGATGATLAIAAATAADAGVYTVTVRNATTAAVSTPATLTVRTAPAVATPPASVIATLGQRAEFSVVASGTPAPTYQWLRNGAPAAGATAATLTIPNVTAADLGTYTVRLTNVVGSVTSAGAVLAVPSAMAVAARFPAAEATAVNPDTPLRLTFDRAVRAGVSGRIRIHRAGDGAVVDTLDLGAPQTRLVGTNPTPYAFLPVIATGATAEIFPRAGVLAYGQSYYVTLEPGTVLDAAGGAYVGSTDPAAWRFTTKNAGPVPGTAAVTVAADGSGDFTTVQGALDFVPAGNTRRTTITVRRGTYREINYLGAAKPFVTLRGEDRAGTVIAYANNANFNAGNNRAMFSCDASDVTFETLTLSNLTPRGGSQAEALRGNGQRVVLDRVTLTSFQDTLLWNGGLFATDCLIEGDVDFMWGGGACHFHRCELRSVGAGFLAQVRNGQTGKGHVYVDCRLTAAPGVTNVFLARIDPRQGVANTWPHSQVVFIDCAMGTHIAREGWRLDNATAAPDVQFWEYRSTDLAGATLDVTGRIAASRRIDETVAAQYRDPRFTVGFLPAVAASVATGPTAAEVRAGSTARLAAQGAGFPAPTYQWFRDGVPVAGATGAELVLPQVRPEDAGAYAVRVTNAGGSATSAPAALTVTRGRWAGTYFGANLAAFVRDDGSAVVLGRSAAGTVLAGTAQIDDAGALTIRGQGTPTAGLAGTIDAGGTLTVAGFGAAARVLPAGPTAAVAGYFRVGATGGLLSAQVIATATGQVLAVTDDGERFDAAIGTVTAGGRVTATLAGGAVLTADVGAGGASLAGQLSAGGRVTALSGPADRAAATQRLQNLSTRARAGTGDNVIVAGFVVTGDVPVNVLVRASGPALAAFGIGGTLPAPRLELFRGAAAMATNTGWAAGGAAGEIAAAGAAVGAFPFPAGSADAALRLTLAPGAYSAIVSEAQGGAGVGLIEVYDLSAGAGGQRLANLSTRAFVGGGDNTLIAGISVSGAVPKRVLVRAAGPALAALGVTGALGRPVLTVLRGSEPVAENRGWSAANQAATVRAAAAESGAFPFANGSADAALVLHLAPGNYTVQITGDGGESGVALVEVYELR